MIFADFAELLSGDEGVFEIFFLKMYVLTVEKFKKICYIQLQDENHCKLITDRAFFSIRQLPEGSLSGDLLFDVNVILEGVLLWFVVAATMKLRPFPMV